MRTLWMAALAFLTLSGVVGAVPLLIHPSDEPWAMPQSLLRHSPFHSYFIPGLILLSANGLLRLWALWLTLRRRLGYGWWVAAQGCVLLGWLVAEVLMLRLIAWPHYLYGAVGLVLVVCGAALSRDAATRLQRSAGTGSL